MDGELDIRAARLHADLAHHGDRGVAHPLVFLVGERLRRGDRDRIAGVNAHRVEVLDRADDDAIVVLVAHHLHLELFPTDHRFFQQHLVNGREVQSALHQAVELVAVVAGEHRAIRSRPDIHKGNLIPRLIHLFVPEGTVAGRRESIGADGRESVVSGTVQLRHVLAHHALAVELRAQVHQRLAHALHPFTSDAFLVTVVIERDDLVFQR